MNFYLLLSRLLAILYAGFFMLFAFGEGVTQHGASHLPAPVLVLIVLILFWERPGWTSLSFGVLFGVSIWFYKSLGSPTLFLIVSLPLAIIAVMSFLAYGKTSRSQ